MKNKYESLVIIFILFITISCCTSCVHEPDLSGQPDICFTGEVLPVFLNNCTMQGCHDGSGDSELSLRTYSEISGGVVPGNSQASEIYKAITSQWEERMPPNQPLSLENRTLIRVWIEQGARETVCANSAIK
ncbi:MAG TPA: c-type cytochrome domain-containing protein [Bacteroidales bacterium]|nr:c-type cytochrome domain-containing protein [Bacteroidales bacterium]